MQIDRVAMTASGTGADGSLRAMLARLLRSGVHTNPALNAVIRDYTTFHVVLVLVGGLFLLAFVALSIFFWFRFARTRTADMCASTFERATYFPFGVLSVLAGLVLALVVAANVSTVLSPRQGFSNSLGMLGSPRAGTRTGDLQQAVATWVQSGSPKVPARVQERIADRLAWQRPKAIVCSVLLVLTLVLGAEAWRTLIAKSRLPEPMWTVATAGLLVTGVVTAAASLLLMLMVMGNTQGSLAPLSLTLFLG